MVFWIKTAGLFLVRSRSSALVLILMVFIAVSSLVFLSSLAVGVNDAMIRNSVSLFSGHISGSDIPSDITEKQLTVKGVQAVLKRVNSAGFLHYNGKTQMVALIAVDPASEKEYTAIWKKTLEGKYLEPGKKEIFPSHSVAGKLNIEPGDTVTFTPGPASFAVSLTVSGIYQTNMDQFDRGVSFCTLKALPPGSGSWNAAIFLKPGADKDRIVAIYRNTRSIENISFKTWSEMMPDLRQLIDLNYISMSIVILLVFIVISFGIACAFSIFILKNLRSYGIMKVMGVTPAETVFLVFTEVIWVNLAASSTGLIAGAAVVWAFGHTGIDLGAYTSHNQYFIVSGMIFPRLTAFSLCLPPASALLFSIPAAVWPAVMVIRKNAAEILRAV